jgi:hypothetical protein
MNHDFHLSYILKLLDRVHNIKGYKAMIPFKIRAQNYLWPAQQCCAGHKSYVIHYDKAPLFFGKHSLCGCFPKNNGAL